MNKYALWTAIVGIVTFGGGAQHWLGGGTPHVIGRAAGGGFHTPADNPAGHASDTRDSSVGTGTATVGTAAELVSALAKGGTIQLEPGTYVGNFTISVPGTSLRGVQPTGRRVTPDDVAAVMLKPGDKKRPTLVIKASNVTVQGLYIASGARDRDCVVIGSPKATSADAQPDGVKLDSVAIVAGEAGGHRGISAHGSHITLTRSHIANFWEVGRDSQAFWANNGPGPYLIEDNYLEGSGENILFGGDSVRIPNLIPSDITIRGNDIVKPIEWKQAHRGAVKNSVEFKNARRVLVENNRIDGCWKDAQNGSVILITPRNQYGDSPWVTVDEVVIRGNVVTNTPDGYAVNILGSDNNHETQQVRRVTIEGNLFRDSRNGVLVSRGVADALVIRRNTFPSIRHNVLTFDGVDASRKPLVLTPLTLDANVFRSGAFGISGAGTSPGVPTLTAWSGKYSVTGNVIERSGKRPLKWPGGNKLVAPGALASLLDPETFRFSGAGLQVGY